MSGDKELINSPYKSHLTRIKSSNTRYRTALNSVVRWKDINRTSRISCKTIGTSSVITLLPNLSCCPSLPVKRKNPSTLRYPRHPSKLQNGSCCTTDYLRMLKMVVFSNCFLFGGSQDESNMSFNQLVHTFANKSSAEINTCQKMHSSTNGNLK